LFETKGFGRCAAKFRCSLFTTWAALCEHHFQFKRYEHIYNKMSGRSWVKNVIKMSICVSSLKKSFPENITIIYIYIIYKKFIDTTHSCKKKKKMGFFFFHDSALDKKRNDFFFDLKKNNNKKKNFFIENEGHANNYTHTFTQTHTNASAHKFFFSCLFFLF
jgi:hypothetical protein